MDFEHCLLRRYEEETKYNPGLPFFRVREVYSSLQLRIALSEKRVAPSNAPKLIFLLVLEFINVPFKNIFSLSVTLNLSTW